MIFKFLTHSFSPGGDNGRLSILIFHRVLQQPDPALNFDIHASAFSQTLKWLGDLFNVLPLDLAVEKLKSGTLPPRAASITFDDGYADNLIVAAPILKKNNMTATFFIASGYLNGGEMWNDTIIESIRHCKLDKLDLSTEGLGLHDLSYPQSLRNTILKVLKLVKYRSTSERERLAKYISTSARVSLRNDLMLSSEQVVRLRDLGMSIGGHTVSHPILSNLSTVEVASEISENKKFLENLLQQRIRLFAYPNGKPNADYRAVDAEVVRNLGFDAAVTTAWGVADSSSDLMQLPRFTPWDRNSFGFRLRMLRNLAANTSLQLEQRAS